MLFYIKFNGFTEFTIKSKNFQHLKVKVFSFSIFQTYSCMVFYY